MGGHRWGHDFPLAPGCSHLCSPCAELTSTQVVAYNRPVFQRILSDLPADVDAMREWIKAQYAIDIYLRMMDKRFLCRPSVASQPVLLAQEDPEYRDCFTLGSAPRETESPAATAAKDPPAKCAESFPRLRQGIEIKVTADRVVLSDPESGRALRLSPTAAYIVDLLDGERSVAQIKDLLKAAFPDSAETIGRDVDRTIDSLKRHGAFLA